MIKNAKKLYVKPSITKHKAVQIVGSGCSCGYWHNRVCGNTYYY